MGFQRIPIDTTVSDVFSVSRDAIAGRLKGPDVAVLATLLQTFYRVQTGQL